MLFAMIMTVEERRQWALSAGVERLAAEIAGLQQANEAIIKAVSLKRNGTDNLRQAPQKNYQQARPLVCWGVG